MIILAIETSCDDTCVALLKVSGEKRPHFTILSNIISSQVKLHAKYGGVYPTLAKREHQKNLPIILKKAIKKAGNPKIDLIGVTIGPGLEPCLWAGVNFAKELSKKMKVQIIPVNHIEAHILVNFFQENSKFQTPNYKNFLPAVCLVVSGGHTQLFLMKDIGKYQILGETRDDAAGECFDKVARILGLGYPGGPIISKLAKSANYRYPISIGLPRPMIYQKNYDFSFSGLKTAVLYKVKSEKRKTKSKKFIQAVAYELQQAVIDVLIYKTLKVAKNCKAKSIILGGGVAANNQLRKQFKERIKKEMPNSKCLMPDSKFCTDNAVMIALTAYYQSLKRGKQRLPFRQSEIKAEANLRIG